MSTSDIVMSLMKNERPSSYISTWLCIPLDLALNGQTAANEENQNDRYGCNCDAKLRCTCCQHDNEKLYTKCQRMIMGFVLDETHLHRDSNECEEVELQQTNHNLIVLVLGCTIG